MEPIIQNVVENSPAAKAGLQAGDKILTVNGRNFDWQHLLTHVQTGNQVQIVIQRANQTSTFSLLPEMAAEGRYLIGIQPTYHPLADKYHTELKYDILTAFEKGLYKVVSLIKTIIQFIGNLLTGELSLSNMGGPISMAKGAGLTAEIGLVYYLSFMALISVNLGVMNLFPILPLDGGQLLLLGAEAVKGKPLSERIYLKFQQLGILFVFGLMAFTLFNDLIRF